MDRFSIDQNPLRLCRVLHPTRSIPAPSTFHSRHGQARNQMTHEGVFSSFAIHLIVGAPPTPAFRTLPDHLQWGQPRSQLGIMSPAVYGTHYPMTVTCILYRSLPVVKPSVTGFRANKLLVAGLEGFESYHRLFPALLTRREPAQWPSLDGA